jgi:DNA gyrase/topoisomerase IV subunit B
MYEETTINHGILKLFDEILTNSVDNITTSIERKTPQTFIYVVLDDMISVCNDGFVPDITIHATYKMYNP